MDIKKIKKSVQDIQDIIVKNNHVDGFYGDGESVVEVPEVPIKHSFADQIYIRQMDMNKDDVVVGAIHNHLHAWFLMKGKIKVATEDSVVTYSAPTYVNAKAGAKRVIAAIEDSVFVNIHPNPDNIKNTDELEDILTCKTYDEYINYKVKN